VGENTARDVEISDPLPAGFTYFSSSTSSTNATRTGTSDPAPGDDAPAWGTWDIDPGGSVTISYVVDVASTVPSGIYDNTAFASSSNHPTVDDEGPVEQDPDTPAGQDPECDEDVVVTPPGGPEVKVTKTVLSPAGAAAGVNDTVRFQITIQNVGTSEIVSLPLSDVFSDAYLTYVSANPSPSNVIGNRILWYDLGPLAIGDTRTLTVDFRARAVADSARNAACVNEAVDENQAPVPSSCDDATLAIDAEASPTPSPTPVGPGSALEVTKTLVDPVGGLAMVGDIVRYQIRIENTGSTDIVYLPLSDIFTDLYMSYATANPLPDNVVGNMIVWYNLGPLAAGDALVVTVDLHAQAEHGYARNAACVGGAVDENQEGVPGDCSQTYVTIECGFEDPSQCLPVSGARATAHTVYMPVMP
jgi:hypothetical protein